MKNKWFGLIMCLLSALLVSVRAEGADEFAGRREKLLDRASGGAVIISSQGWRGRAHSHFRYLTGREDREAILVLLPGDSPRSILFTSRQGAPDGDMETKKFDYRAVVLVILAAAAAGVFFTMRQKDSLQRPFEPALLEVGGPAPDFTLPGIEGRMVSLSDYRGKVVLVNFWATWCPPCVAEMPSMQKLHQRLKGDSFEILAVSIDTQGIGAVAPFMEKHGLTFPVLIDTEGLTKTAYNTTGVPESFIIDRQGLLVKKIVGPLDWASPEALAFFRELMQ